MKNKFQITIPKNKLKEELEKRNIEFVYEVFPIEILNSLKNDNIYDLSRLDKHKQTISKLNFTKPIIVSNDFKIIDGKHVCKSYQDLQKDRCLCLKIDLPYNRCCNVLKTIQSEYDKNNYNDRYKKIKDKEEEIQDINKDETGEFNIDNIKNQYQNIFNDENKNVIIGYRQNNININSECGNFFTLSPTSINDVEYKINVDNLYEIDNDFIMRYNDNILLSFIDKTMTKDEVNNFINRYNYLPKENLIKKIITDKSKELNIEGIKYGDVLLQIF